MPSEMVRYPCPGIAFDQMDERHCPVDDPARVRGQRTRHHPWACFEKYRQAFVDLDTKPQPRPMHTGTPAASRPFRKHLDCKGHCSGNIQTLLRGAKPSWAKISRWATPGTRRSLLVLCPHLACGAASPILLAVQSITTTRSLRSTHKRPCRCVRIRQSSRAKFIVSIQK